MDSLTLVFRGINISTIVENYTYGFYKNVTKLEETNIEIKNEGNNQIVRKTEKSNNYYEVTPEVGRPFVYVLYLPNEQLVYKSVPTNINGKKYNCMHCLKENLETGIGIPVLKKEIDGNVFWHCVEIFCSFNCMFSELRNKLVTEHTLFSESLILTSELFENCTGQPFSSLKPANDRRLLKKWNGHMDYNQFHENPGYYVSIPNNYFFTPVIQTIPKSQ